MISFRTIEVRDLFGSKEHLQMIKDHHDEVEDGKLKLDINFNWYYSLEEKDMLIVTGVYDCNKLVGYSMDTLLDNPHYGGKRFAINDIIYLQEQYRHLGLMEDLLNAVTIRLKQRYVVHHTVTLKTSQSCSGVMKKLNYKNPEISYQKNLEAG